MGKENEKVGKENEKVGKEKGENVGKETEKVGKEGEKVGKESLTFEEKLGIKLERENWKLGKTKAAILRMAYENPAITTAEMAERLHVALSGVEKHISEMRGVFLKNTGGRRYANWEVLLD